MRRSVFMALLMSTVILAGCVGDGDEVTTEPTDLEPDEPVVSENSGSITGKVMDESFNPLPGIDVLLNDEFNDLVDQTATNEEGRYTFNDLKRGIYRVFFNHPCCFDQVADTTVTRGEVSTLDIQMTQRPKIVPYMVPDKWTGFVSCDVAVPVVRDPVTCPEGMDPNRDIKRTFTPDMGLETLVIALDWDPAPTNVHGTMRLRLLIDNIEVIVKSSEAPLEFRFDNDPTLDEGVFDWADWEEPPEFTFRVWGGDAECYGCSNVVWQQSFTVYWDLYYNKAAPDGASALPDG